ncbi:MAG: class I SAM-dependent methyltransferase [Bacilli bacterium]
MLTRRLQAIAAYIKADDVVADIGSDHGKIPRYLISQGHSYVYANENKKGPYNRLKEELNDIKDGLIEVDLADGLNKLPARVNTIVIAGMGGELIGDILSKRSDKLDTVKKLILAPNGAEESLRRLISYLGFTIVSETVIEEKGKFYEILVAENRPCLVCGVETKFGAYNMMIKSDAFLRKWQEVYHRNEVLLANPDLSPARRAEILEEQAHIQKALTKKD